MKPNKPWLRLATIIAATLALLVASPLGMIGISALGFLIPTGIPAPHYGAGFLLFPVWLCVACGLPAALLAATIRYRQVEWAAALLGVCLLMWGTFAPAKQLVRMSRYRGLATVAASGRPIVNALAHYRSDHGEFPESLEALVPNYLSNVPGTGLATYPSFNYYRSENGQSPRDYELTVSIPVAPLDFSTFQYQPRQDYPAGPHSGVEVVGEWAIFID
jgi:hypothetical protein